MIKYTILIGILISNSVFATTKEQVTLLEHKCNNGDTSSCYLSGLRYHNGDGIEIDNTIAARYFKLVCDTDVIGCVHLGDLYYNGQGVKKDKHKAMELYQYSCDTDHNSGCEELGDMYSSGDSIKINAEIAFKLYERACPYRGTACEKVAYSYMHGIGVTENKKAAKDVLTSSCYMGDRSQLGKPICKNYMLILRGDKIW